MRINRDAMIGRTRLSSLLSRVSGFFSMPEWLERVGSRPVFGLVATLAIVFAGVCASLFTSTIKAGVSSWISLSSMESAGGLVFWLSVFVAGLFFWINHAAHIKRTERARMDLEAAVKRLNTIPSETFLPTNSGCWKRASAVTFACIAARGRGLGRAEVDAAIVAVESAILESARDFDGLSRDARYSANIMLWRNKGERLEQQDALNIARGAPQDPTIAGILELIPALSLTLNDRVVAGGVATADHFTRAIVLPVPEEHDKFLDDDGVEKIVLLPGAPLAFASGSCTVFSRMQDFLELLRNGTTLDERIKRRVQRYFTEGEGRHIRSFASFAILPVNSDGLPLGVLNIHSNCSGLLEENGETLFAPVLAPFLSLLAVLLTLRSEASAVTASRTVRRLVSGRQRARAGIPPKSRSKY